MYWMAGLLAVVLLAIIVAVLHRRPDKSSGEPKPKTVAPVEPVTYPDTSSRKTPGGMSIVKVTKGKWRDDNGIEVEMVEIQVDVDADRPASAFRAKTLEEAAANADAAIAARNAARKYF